MNSKNARNVDGVPREDAIRTPHPSRLALAHPRRTEILGRHDDALDAGLASYRDPVSGFAVFTAALLATRGTCCTSGCRHCPYVDD